MPSPSGSTARYGLPYPLETDAPDAPTWGAELTELLDGVMMTTYQGLAAARPAAGILGRCYYATDTGQFSLDVALGWVSPLTGNPACRVVRSGSYNIPNSAGVLPYDTVTYDDLSGFSTSTHLYTVSMAGRYRVTGGCGYQGTAADSQLWVSVYHNGSAYGMPNQIVGANGDPLAASVSDTVQCVVGDTLAVAAQAANSSTPVGFHGSPGGAFMTIELVSQ